eukprot:TRINITY_DN96021_c0_g1_i1.p1 TRINITY_DN96021_c0_g1~~TRINITY_DN96021_c0_g1_i1.p1  ORF type:complete len:395 (-),score=96.91 TRINITY_DN96021_c0_g1_i1:158-1342(-)
MLLGDKKRFFPGCYAFLGDLKASPQFSKQRCIVKNYLADKQRFHIKLWDPKFGGKEVLVQESNLSFDSYAAPPLLLPRLPADLSVRNMGAVGNALFCNRDISEGEIILKESPMMVVSNKDIFASRWNLHFGIENEQPDAEVLRAFQELSDGGMADAFYDDAKALLKTMLNGAGQAEKHLEAMMGKSFLESERQRIAGVLSRWQSNCHSFQLDNDSASYSGLYRYTAKCNHSCDANCQTIIEKATGRMLLRAKRKIFEGEELCTNYMSSDPNFKDAPVEERQMLLLKRGFTCVCSRCSRESKHKEAGPGVRSLPVVSCGVPVISDLETFGLEDLGEQAASDRSTRASEGYSSCPSTANGAAGLTCHGCKSSLPKADFSKKQLQRRDQRRCKNCTA